MQGRDRGKRMTVENSVPEDLIIDIFAKLPVKSLIRFMCLSKSCYQAISDPQFFRLHLRHSNQINKQIVLQIGWGALTLQYLSFCHHQLLREPVTLDSPILLVSDWQWEIVGSCNGVLCLTASPEGIHYLGILNLSIKRLKLVLFPNLGDSLCPSYGRYRSVDGTLFSTEIGFGFDSRTSDFKIVIILREIYSERWRQVQVYSLRKNSWKVLSNVPNSIYNIYQPQVVVNGAFYWFGKSVISDCYSFLMFDFTDETFKEIKMPDCFHEDLGKFVRLGEVKGKLSLLLYLDEDEDSSAGDSLAMWVMEDSGWVRQFVVNVSDRPTCLAMNDEVMLLSDFGHILSCDLKTLELTDHEVKEKRPCAFTYTPSLALLGEDN